MKLEENRLTFPELDISIDSGFMRRCDFIGLMGPDGLSTRSEVPPDIEGYAGNKDAFVEALINEAEKAGAGFWFNAKVVDVIRDNDQVKGLRLDTGQEIHSKVVVTADGVFAKISEKVGMNICHDDVWYAEVLAYEYENTPELPAGLYYFNGDMQYEQDMPTILGGFGVTDVIHVLVAVFSRRKYHCAPKPLDHYVELMLEKDRRIRQIAGDSLKGMRPSMLTGCRGVFREKPNREIAGNGVISVGDAWVDDGELGNVPALANGVHAGRCITAASENSDFSKESLSEADSFISSKLVDVLSKNKNFKLMGATLSNDELRRMFLFMQHMNYPVMMLGSPVQQGLMFTNFMIRNFFRFFRYPGTLKRMF